MSILCALLLLFCCLQSEFAVARKNNAKLPVSAKVVMGSVRIKRELGLGQ